MVMKEHVTQQNSVAHQWVLIVFGALWHRGRILKYLVDEFSGGFGPFMGFVDSAKKFRTSLCWCMPIHFKS